MNRRTFVQSGLAASMSAPLLAALRTDKLDEASEVLARAVASGQVAAAVLHVTHCDLSFNRAFGKARSEDAMFLLGSISKPIAVTALMTLFDQGAFQLDDPLQKYVPQFTGEGKNSVTIRHLLTHVSGLADQLTDNDALRARHAGLSEFIEHAIRAPLHFVPGSRYDYSSMGILLATHVAELITSMDITSLVDRAVFQPLGMKHSAQGLGRFSIDEMIPVQTEFAAVEAGGGNPKAKDWNWNSSYWRKLGAPWGGTHASAPDIGKFLDELMYEKGTVVRPETARMMVSNHNPPGITPRGLGFNLSRFAGAVACSEKTFGHTGSTGTLALADPDRQLKCVVLTSLPGTAVQPHPRELAAIKVFAE
ncbi:MAG: serine hydrolase domain-containing protein [Pirellulaceae bacterium]|nr:serine hydrolase domain-containing protein [Pirellulaceae bacterium]